MGKVEKHFITHCNVIYVIITDNRPVEEYIRIENNLEKARNSFSPFKDTKIHGTQHTTGDDLPFGSQETYIFCIVSE